MAKSTICKTPHELGGWIQNAPVQAPLLVTLTGDLGAGKTEWVRQLVRVHGGVADDVSSPTYSLHNIYSLKDGTTVHHLDLYRLKSSEELDGIGFWELFDTPAIICVEWPQFMGSLHVTWPRLQIHLQKLSNGSVELQATFG